MKVASSLPDHVLREIHLFARRLKRSRAEIWADSALTFVRRSGHALLDALDGLAHQSVRVPPP